MQSRYYDPETGRFINADTIDYLDPESINGLNLYAYCNNNPVMYTDSTGTNWWSDFWNSTAGKIVGTILTVAVVIAGVVVITVATAGVGTAVAGSLGGGVAATIAGGAIGGAVTGAMTGAVIGAGVSFATQGISGGYNNVSLNDVASAAVTGAISGAITGGIFGAIGSAVKVCQAARMWDNGTFRSGFQSMRYHYVVHGQEVGAKTILQYTSKATAFATRNASNMIFNANYTGMQSYWSAGYTAGADGYFTSIGKIITYFWR